jgi:predicted nucleotidyltransferase
MNYQLKTILKSIETYLKNIYQEELDKIILFGSQARGDAMEESDIDILIVLKHPFRYYQKENISSRKHSGVISAFGQYFAKTEKVPQHYHRYLIEAEKLRKGADDNLDIDINHGEASQVIQQAEEMLSFAFNNLLNST